MRIGEILLEHGWVDPAALARALAEQRQVGLRLCSMLIGRGQLDPDHAARALGEQHQVAAVLQRHLQHREHALARLLPGSLARACLALPLGRMRGGELIVCVRDPRPELHAVLAQAIDGPIVLAVAPAHQLERLIDAEYERSPTDEFDVDLTTGPIVSVDVDLSVTGPIAIGPFGGDALPELAAMTLVELDDARVARDPTQSGMSGPSGPSGPSSTSGMFAPPPPPPPPRRARSLEEALDALATATTRDAATELAMERAAARWHAALLLTIKDGAALGHRGHGAQLAGDAAQAVVLPLAAPSLVKLAHDHHHTATEVPAGAVQDRLARVLGHPRAPAAAPVRIGARVALVLAVGDPIARPGDDEPAPLDELERLADALGAAYARIVRDRKA